MARIEKFEDIEAWKSAREVTRLIYKVSSKENFNKDFALVNQIRRASVSILSNIAEGFERGGDREFIQFLTIAKGSSAKSASNFMLLMTKSILIKNNTFWFRIN